jgi:hypothetical protein
MAPDALTTTGAHREYVSNRIRAPGSTTRMVFGVAKRASGRERRKPSLSALFEGARRDSAQAPPDPGLAILNTRYAE